MNQLSAADIVAILTHARDEQTARRAAALVDWIRRFKANDASWSRAMESERGLSVRGVLTHDQRRTIERLLDRSSEVWSKLAAAVFSGRAVEAVLDEAEPLLSEYAELRGDAYRLLNLTMSRLDAGESTARVAEGYLAPGETERRVVRDPTTGLIARVIERRHPSASRSEST